jgi:ribose-phosphate pyrophosphokinase
VISDDRPPQIFSLDAGADLAARVCAQLSLVPARHEERSFEDGEHKVRPLESVRGRDVYLVQSLAGDQRLGVDARLCRSLFLCGALRDAGAARLTAVLPYLCYARKDRRTKPRDPVTLRYVAALIEAIGVDRVVTLDVHNPAAYENAFRIPAEHLTARGLFVDHLAPLIGARPAVVVSPDAGGVKRAESLRAALERGLGREVGLAFLEKHRSEGVVSGEAVIGELAGRVAVIVDDLIASGTTLARAAAACRERGAREVHAVATHAVFTSAAGRTLAASALDRVIVLDTAAPVVDREILGERLGVLAAAPLLGAAIARLHRDGSLLGLQDVSTELEVP